MNEPDIDWTKVGKMQMDSKLCIMISPEVMMDIYKKMREADKTAIKISTPTNFETSFAGMSGPIISGPSFAPGKNEVALCYPTITVFNQSVLTEKQVRDWIEAALVYVNEHFIKDWWIGANIIYSDKGVIPGTWGFGFFNDSDQAGAAGYHDLTPDGMPFSKSFVADDLKYGMDWSVTASHELLEILADPWINRTAFYAYDTGVVAYALEVADPCEDDSLGIPINGIKMTDYVTQNYFNENSTDKFFDKACKIETPLTILKNGYLSVFENGHWNQKTARLLNGRNIAMNSQMGYANAKTPSMIGKVGSRREKRLRGHHSWNRSTIR